MEQAWRFGPYILSARRRRLERDGVEVALGARSFALLVELVRRAGEVVGKAELMKAVWGDIVVDDSSVRVHIAQLRKALDGEGGWIANVPLRGYLFRGAVVALPDSGPSTGRAVPCAPAGLPPASGLLVGRAAELALARGLLEQETLLTLAGPGGIGKTALALAVARHWAACGRGGVLFADLAPARTAAQILPAIGAAPGTPGQAHEDGAGLRDVAAAQPGLLLLDNCEHLLDALAPVVAALRRRLPWLRILATSREPLRLPGERVLRLAALPAPAPAAVLALEQAMAHPAVELLAARAAAAGAGPFADTDAAALARIARRLDGIPLALELVAPRLAAATPADLAARMDEHMELRSGGGRGVLPRHRTMEAVLDWSHALLDAAERRLLRRLSVFDGPFGLDAALRVAGLDADAEAAFTALGGLVAKSLVLFDPRERAPYRLLAVTRTYAGRHLTASGERDAVLACRAGRAADALSMPPGVARQEGPSGGWRPAAPATFLEALWAPPHGGPAREAPGRARRIPFHVPGR